MMSCCKMTPMMSIESAESLGAIDVPSGLRASEPGGRPGPEAADALKELLIEATLLHWHVASASRMLAGPDDLTNAQVSILRTVHAAGAQTVPELAAQRGVTRQPVQRTVGELQAMGLVALAANPRHKRSRLVTLTSKGRRRLVEMERRQSSWTRDLADGLSERSLRTASRLLRRIRERISTRIPTRMSLRVPTRGRRT